MARTAPQPIGKLNEQKVYNNNCVSINYFRKRIKLLVQRFHTIICVRVRCVLVWLCVLFGIWTHIGGAVQGLFASPVMLHESDRCVMGPRTCLLRSSRHSGLASAISPRDGGERSLSIKKEGRGGAFCGLFKVES